MATTIEYALLAGVSYYDTRADINRFPMPQNWSYVSRIPQDTSTGFEASAFTNGTEIVISYAGTYDKDITGDMAADFGLATGYGSAQLLQAAEYYLQVRAQYGDNARITLTGHSLGGGLAALIGVFFGVEATTFDQAPFANSAEDNLLTPDVAANLKADLLAQGYSEEALSGLTNYLQLRETNGGIPNSNLVTNIDVVGEFLSGFPWNIPDRIGTTVLDITNGATGVSGTELHSQALLTAFLLSSQSATSGNNSSPPLNEVSKKLPNLLKLIFDTNLFANDTDPNTNKRNFLEHLVRHQAGVPGEFAADDMLIHFTNDMQDIVTAGGKDQDQYPYINLNKALIPRSKRTPPPMFSKASLVKASFCS